MVTPVELLQEYLDGINKVLDGKDLSKNDKLEVSRQRLRFSSTIEYLKLWRKHNNKMR